jgi:hypothetical protein
MPEEFSKPTENRWEKTEPGELPLPPEHPREEVYRALSVGGGILCLLLTAAIIVFLFYYANIEEQAAKESQKTAEAMRDNAERLIASLTEDLRQQQGKPVDAKFAGRISYDVSSYYGNPTIMALLRRAAVIKANCCPTSRYFANPRVCLKTRIVSMNKPSQFVRNWLQIRSRTKKHGSRVSIALADREMFYCNRENLRTPK